MGGEGEANPRSKIAEYARNATLDAPEEPTADASAEPVAAGGSAADDEGPTDDDAATDEAEVATPEKLVAVGPDHPMGAVTAVDDPDVPVLDEPDVAPSTESGTVDAG